MGVEEAGGRVDRCVLGEVDEEGRAGEDERVVADEQAGDGEEGVEGAVQTRAGR